MTEPVRPLEALIAELSRAHMFACDIASNGVEPEKLNAIGFAIRNAKAMLLQAAAPPAPQPASVPPQTQMADAAEMLWVVLANVSGGDWTKQSADWQEYAARWRDNYFAAVKASSVPVNPPVPVQRTAVGADAYRERLRRHIAAIDGRRPQDGHSDRGFSVCPHPDCVAMQSTAAPPAPTAERKWIASGMTSYTADGEVTGYVNPPAAPPERVSEGHQHSDACYGRQDSRRIGPLCGFAESRPAVEPREEK